jgi:histidinol-phosphatase (PHP family)
MLATKDLHVHESHSGDAPGATVEGYCRVAEERGIDEIGFATHLIITGPDTDYSIPPEYIAEYIEEVDTAQASTDVRLRTGLEVDYFPEEAKRLEMLLDEYTFDFVLGSLHYIHGHDIGSRRGTISFFSGKKIDAALDDYYGVWGEAVESGLFDVMAHPDYFRKYIHLVYAESPVFEEYGSQIYKAFDSLRSCGVGVEVNSSGYRHGIEDCFPSLGFMKAAREAGVETVTIGSDCHSVENLGMRLEEAVRRLADAGYTHISVFKKRRNRKLLLNNIIK